MTTFTPPERWPFLAGEAVYYVQYTTGTRPITATPAIVLACQTLRNLPLGCSKASVQRADKSRTSSVRANSLVYRGYCGACEVPAIVGPADTLICPRCQDLAVPLPPPDDLVVRFFPLSEYTWSRAMRFQAQHPTWPWQQARAAANDVFDTAYEGMLARLGLRRLYHSGDYDRPIGDQRGDQRLLNILDAAALLGDAALFLSAHQELSERQSAAGRSRYLAQRLLNLSPERLEATLDLILDLGGDEEPPPAAPAVSFIPLPERPEDDAQPDGADEMTRWLEEQFRKKAA